MTNTAELKKLAEAAKLTGYQLLEMSINDMAEAQRLKQQFRQIRPEAILKLLAINAELVEALKVSTAHVVELCTVFGVPLTDDSIEKISAALAKAEGGEL